MQCVKGSNTEQTCSKSKGARITSSTTLSHISYLFCFVVVVYYVLFIGSKNIRSLLGITRNNILCMNHYFSI